MCNVDLFAETVAQWREGEDGVIVVRQELEPLENQLHHSVHRLDIRMLFPEKKGNIGISFSLTKRTVVANFLFLVHHQSVSYDEMYPMLLYVWIYFMDNTIRNSNQFISINSS